MPNSSRNKIYCVAPSRMTTFPRGKETVEILGYKICFFLGLIDNFLTPYAAEV